MKVYHSEALRLGRATLPDPAEEGWLVGLDTGAGDGYVTVEGPAEEVAGWLALARRRVPDLGEA